MYRLRRVCRRLSEGSVRSDRPKSLRGQCGCLHFLQVLYCSVSSRRDRPLGEDYQRGIWLDEYQRDVAKRSRLPGRRTLYATSSVTTFAQLSIFLRWLLTVLTSFKISSTLQPLSLQAFITCFICFLISSREKESVIKAQIYRRTVRPMRFHILHAWQAKRWQILETCRSPSSL